MLLDGKLVSREYEEKLKVKVESLVEKYHRPPSLVVILVGENPASMSYVKSKEKASKRVGINGTTLRLSENIKEEELIKIIDKLNNDKNVDGMIVQLPLPNHINKDKVLNRVLPEKDVDGLSLLNAGKLASRQKSLQPATPKGIMMLLDYYNIPIKGKYAVIVGASNLVGAPMARLLLHRDATVTVCHIHTKDLAHHTREADILVVATGVINLINGDMIKKGAVVVDVGINRLDGKIVGDVNFESCEHKASYITPVPGGVGPMTINALMHNVIEAFEDKYDR